MSKQHVDKNFLIESEIKKDDLIWRNALSAPFSVHGVFYENGKYRRLPEAVAASVSDNVYVLHTNTAGGRVRFITDSSVIAISASYSNVCRFSHIAMTGSVGFDLYAKEEGEERESFRFCFRPPNDMVDSYESRADLGERKMREITVNMPTYSDVTRLEIGIESDAQLLAPLPFDHSLPIVYYGNSITQGACATRPANAFAAYASRAVNCDFINLGFSGAGLAEPEIAKYISELDMQIFVYDYDHNAPSVEHLAATHERMFKTIREKHPELPVVFMTRTSFAISEEQRVARFNVIRSTYEGALGAGDKNVYFIDGSKIYGDMRDEATIERTHPNDLGQVLIGKELARVLAQILKR